MCVTAEEYALPKYRAENINKSYSIVKLLKAIHFFIPESDGKLGFFTNKLKRVRGNL